MQGLVALSRLGVYIRVPGVDVAKFEQSISGGGLLGYIDALSGGSISKVGVFSLGQQALNPLNIHYHIHSICITIYSQQVSSEKYDNACSSIIADSVTHIMHYVQ